jgi:hypothetical protein
MSTMIVKNFDPKCAEHEYERLRQDAQERISQLLKSGFGLDNKGYSSVRVFHGLRLEFGPHAVHFDHILMHRYGFIVIENRAEQTDFMISSMGEWTQIYHNSPLRISSPMIQGERKAKALRSFLEYHRSLLRIQLPKPRGFNVAFDYIVVTNEAHELEMAPGMVMPQQVKSNYLIGYIEKLIQARRKDAHGFWGLKATELELDVQEQYKITALLRTRHQPLKTLPPVLEIRQIEEEALPPLFNTEDAEIQFGDIEIPSTFLDLPYDPREGNG